MTPRDHVANEAELPRGTLPELFLEAVDRRPDGPALTGWDGEAWVSTTYREALERVRELSAGLRSLELGRGDKVALLSENRPEWALSDYACQCAGVVDVPVYPSLPADQIRYLLDDSGARVALVSTAEQLGKVLAVRDELPELREVVVFDPPGELPAGVRTLASVVEAGRGEAPDEAAFREEAMRAAPDDVATILYTSGTTGPPKGVMLTQDNLASNVRACERVLDVGRVEDSLCLLPLSHVFQRMVDFLFFANNVEIAYARSIETVAEDLKTIRPQVAVSVPRLYEKVYARVMGVTGPRALLVRWAKSVGLRCSERELRGERPGLLLRLQRALADRLVFRKLRDAIGGRIEFFVSGGAALSADINRFFHAAGITILEGYGLTETSPVTNVNTFEDFRIGTVGKPVPGTEERIGDDGELLVRGPQVMKGYYGLPSETDEALEDDGWFHTGDIAEIDDDGFVSITDRKKDIFVTSGGKNIAPQPIENDLKRNAFVAQAVMVGDGRKFASVLIVPDFEALREWAAERGVAASSKEELLAAPEVQEHMMEQVTHELRELAGYQTPKKVGLIPEELTIEGGALTPTQKVKRRVVEERYADLIERFYRSGFDENVFVPGNEEVRNER